MKESFEQKYVRFLEGKPEPVEHRAVPFVELPGFDALMQQQAERETAEMPWWAMLFWLLMVAPGEVIFDACQPEGKRVEGQT